MPPVVEKFSEDLHDTYKIIRKRPQEEEWPPYQPKSIVNVTVIHYKNKQTRQELIKISDHFQAGIDELTTSPPSQSKVTKDISEIFKVDLADKLEDDAQNEPPKLILIEGAPGIGKTVMAKEIAYLWANYKLLTNCKLVILVYLRDPRVHTMKSVGELLQLYTSSKVSTEVNDYLEKCSGHNVAFVFDGFDEFPVPQKDSVVLDIIGIGNNYGRKFCRSIVVVTSRPTATLSLDKMVDRKIEILGFAPEERKKLISLSFSQYPDRKPEIDEYFKLHPIISSLCYIPLNLAILLYLFHQGSLPETLTELNESFVVHTVYRHMKKILLPNIPGCIYHLKDMPANIKQILHKLSRLAYMGLKNNQLVFTYDDLKNVCPEVYDNTEAVNGFGLLHAVEHHPQKGVGTITSFNFLHLTMQEYLAAYYVTTLSKEEQFTLLQRTFWHGYFNFMWMMYVGTVGVKSDAFGSFIETKILRSIKRKIKYLHLFQCYMEANAKSRIPKAVSSVFNNGNINLTGITLLSYHVTSLLYFMSASVQQWKRLKLSNCKLQRGEMYNIMQYIINNKKIMSTLNYVDLSCNGSSPWGVYCAIIRHCCVNSLTLCGDEGMKEYIKEIADSLQANVTLWSLTLLGVGKIGLESIKELLISNVSLKNLKVSWETVTRRRLSNPEKVTISVNVSILYDNNDVNHSQLLFELVCTHSYNSNSIINLSGKNINDDAVHVLVFGLCNDTTVEELNISCNEITDEGAVAIIDCLKYNKTIKKLDLSQNAVSSNGMNKMLENIENQGTMLSLEYFDMSKNESSPWGVYCAIIRHCTNSLTLCGDEGMKEYIKEITDSLQANTTLQSLTLLDGGKIGVELIKELVMNNFCLKKLEVSWETVTSSRLSKPNKVTIFVNVSILYDNDDVSHRQLLFELVCTHSYKSNSIINLSGQNINDDAVHVLVFGLCNDTTVEELNISCNEITDEGAVAIIDCLKYNKTIKKLDLSQNAVSSNGMNKMLENIENQGTMLSLEYFDMSKNKSSPWGVYCAIIRHCTNSLTLCGDEGMKEYIKEITDSLQANTTLQSLTLLDGGKIGVELIKELVIDNVSLKKLEVSWETVTSSRLSKPNKVTIFVNVSILYDNDDVSHHQLLFELVCTHSYKSNSIINLSGQNINDDAVHVLVFGLCNDTTVEELNISCNEITDEGAVAIIDCLKYNKTIKKLDLSQNAVSSNGMNKMLENIENQGTMLSLEYFDMSKNESSPWGVYCAIIKHCCTKSLTLCGDEGMKAYIKEIADSLQVNATLHSLILVGIGKIGVESVKKLLMNIVSLKNLKVSWETVINNMLGIPDKVIISVYVSILYYKGDSHLLSKLFCTHNYSSNSINLSRKNINDDAVHMLVFGLCNNTTVEELNISCNKITDEGAVAIIDCLKYNKTVKKLDLSQNEVSSNGMNKMLENIENQGTMISLEYFDMSKNKSSPWGVYCAIIRHCCTNSLTLRGNEGMKEYIKEITDSLQANTTLQSLTLLSGGKIGVELIKKLVMNNYLKKLEVSWETVTNNRLSKPNKVTISVNVSILYDNDDVSHRQLLFELVCTHSYNSNSIINLSGKNINDDAVYVLVFGLCNDTTVEELNISCNEITDEGAVAITDCLKYNKTIKKLDLSQNAVSSNGMNKMLENIENQGTMLSLEYFDMSKNKSSPWGVYCAIIRHCTNSLTLCGDEGMKEYIKEITDSLQANTALHSLTLLGVGKIGLQSISEVLMNKVSLKELKVSWETVICSNRSRPKNVTISVNVSILYCNDDVSHCQLLSELVCTHSYDSNSIINLSRKNINDDAVHVLVFGLCDNTTVEELNISCNEITDEGAVAIIDCLKYNKTIKKLNLSQNAVSSNGMNKILENIENQGTMISLEYFDMSKNKSSPWGVYCAIIRCCCTNSLTLCGDEGMREYIKEITDSLQANTTLHSLTLLSVGKIGLQSMSEALMNKVSLKKLKVSWETVISSTLSIPNKVTISVNVSILYCNDDVNHSQLLFKLVCPRTSYESNSINLIAGPNIDDDALSILAFGLCSNTTVEELNILFKHQGAMAITDNLKCKVLDLSNTTTDIYGMNRLLYFIENQRKTLSLKYVNLNENFVSPAGLPEVISISPWGVYCAIIRKCCVNSLTLCGDKGMKEFINEIADSLQANIALQSLTLLSIGKIGVESAKVVLLNNFTLKQLNLSWRLFKSNDVENVLMYTSFSPTTNTDDVTQNKRTMNVTNRTVNISILCDDVSCIQSSAPFIP